MRIKRNVAKTYINSSQQTLAVDDVVKPYGRNMFLIPTTYQRNRQISPTVRLATACSAASVGICVFRRNVCQSGCVDWHNDLAFLCRVSCHRSLSLSVTIFLSTAQNMQRTPSVRLSCRCKRMQHAVQVHILWELALLYDSCEENECDSARAGCTLRRFEIGKTHNKLTCRPTKEADGNC